MPDAVAKKNATKTRGGSIKNTRAPLEKREVKDKQLGLSERFGAKGAWRKQASCRY